MKQNWYQQVCAPKAKIVRDGVTIYILTSKRCLFACTDLEIPSRYIQVRKLNSEISTRNLKPNHTVSTVKIHFLNVKCGQNIICVL